MVADSGIRMLLNNFYDSPPIIQAIFLPDHMPASSSRPFDVGRSMFNVRFYLFHYSMRLTKRMTAKGTVILSEAWANKL
jgi:hypothetical protein